MAAPPMVVSEGGKLGEDYAHPNKRLPMWVLGKDALVENPPVGIGNSARLVVLCIAIELRLVWFDVGVLAKSPAVVVNLVCVMLSLLELGC